MPMNVSMIRPRSCPDSQDIETAGEPVNAIGAELPTKFQEYRVDDSALAIPMDAVSRPHTGTSALTGGLECEEMRAREAASSGSLPGSP